MALDYVSIDRTKDQLLHAIDVTENISSASALKVETAQSVGSLSDASGTQSTAVGYNATASGTSSLAIGRSAKAQAGSATATGPSAEATSSAATAVGYNAKATAQNAIQIGAGTNSATNTAKINNTEILNSSGKIPVASIEANKFNPKLVAGSNVTLTDNQDGTQTISASGGGGGGSYTAGDGIVIDDDEISVDLVQTTGDNEDKVMSQDAVTTALSGKQNAFSVGKGLTLANSVLSANVRRWLFIDTKPTEDIDQNAVYLQLDSQFFPDVYDNYIEHTGGNYKGAVTLVDNVYKFIWFYEETGNRFYDSGSAQAKKYRIYITDGVSWTLEKDVSTADNDWCTEMGWTKQTTTTGSTSGYQNIIWSNANFSYMSNTYKHYDPANNIANADGTAVDTSSLPPYQYKMWQYNGSSWEALGVCDFEQLFNKVETEIASKADSSTTYTKTEVDTALANKVSSSSVETIWTGTQAEYDAITTKDSDTLYFVVEAV